MKGVVTRKRWDKEEVDILERKYQTYGSSIPELDRSKPAIQCKAMHLGLKFDGERKFSKEHRRALSESHKGCKPWNKGQHYALVNKTCVICGKEFQVERSELKRDYERGKYCSINCRNTGFSGAGNPRAKWVKKYSREDIERMMGLWESRNWSIDTLSEYYGIPETSLTRLFKLYFPGRYASIVEQHMCHGRPYRIGRNFEYRVRDYYKNKGYHVFRSPRSGGPADLVAMKKGEETLFIQCKCSGQLTRKEKERLRSLATSLDGQPIVVSRKGPKERWDLVFEEVV